MNRRVLVNLGVFTLVFILGLVYVATSVVSFRFIERPYVIHGDFAAASGILPRAEVAYLGVHYGTVDRVERTTDGVRITMAIDRGKRIPAGSTAHIFRKSAIGEPFIDFFPPPDDEGTDGPFIEPGEVVPRERTTIPLEFSEMLRSASRLLEGIDPEAVGSLVHELALALDGRTDALRDLTVAGDDIAATFAARTDLLDRLADRNARLTRLLAEHRGSLGRSITNLARLARTLREADGDLATILDEGGPLLDRTAAIVHDELGNLDCIMGVLETVVDETTSDARLDQLRTLLDVGPGAFDKLWSTRDLEPDGLWVRVNLTVAEEGETARQYVPPHELPAVPPIGSCDSPLSDHTVRSAAVGGPALPVPAPVSLSAASVMGALALALGVGNRRWAR